MTSIISYSTSVDLPTDAIIIAENVVMSKVSEIQEKTYVKSDYRYRLRYEGNKVYLRPSDSYLNLCFRIANDENTVAYDANATYKFALINDLKNLFSVKLMKINNHGSASEEVSQYQHIVNTINSKINTSDSSKRTYGQLYGDYDSSMEYVENTNQSFSINTASDDQIKTSLQKRVRLASIASLQSDNETYIRAKIPLTHLFSFFEQNDYLFTNTSFDFEFEFHKPSVQFVVSTETATKAAAIKHRLVWGTDGGMWIDWRTVELSSESEIRIKKEIAIPKMFKWERPILYSRRMDGVLNGSFSNPAPSGKLSRAFVVFQMEDNLLSYDHTSSADLFTGLGLSKLKFELSGTFIPLSGYELAFPHHRVVRDATGVAVTSTTHESHKVDRAYSDFLKVVSTSNQLDVPGVMSMEKWINSPIFAFDLSKFNQKITKVNSSNTFEVTWNSLATGLLAYHVHVVFYKEETIEIDFDQARVRSLTEESPKASTVTKK